jgi:SAM-dependent methyltransferase
MVSKEEILDFKLEHSDENKIIAATLRGEFADWLGEPILDVGCGAGDIAAGSFGERQAVLLDRLDYSEFPNTAQHTRVIQDFFDYYPLRSARPKSMLFCHVLQFLDDDLSKLRDRVDQLAPDQVVTVLNANDGLLGEILFWLEKEGLPANPEVHVDGFPPAYVCQHLVRLTSHVTAEGFSHLAAQISYLMDMKPDTATASRLETFLRERLATPRFEIAQEIRAYRKMERYA